MIISFIVLAALSALVKKIGGYDNTKLHGNLMTLALALGGFGFYVIYSVSDEFILCVLLFILSITYLLTNSTSPLSPQRIKISVERIILQQHTVNLD